MARTFVATAGVVIMLSALVGPLALAQSAPPKAAAPAKTKSASPKVIVRASASTANPVNLNTATAADLQTLPKIGAAAAARIIEYREKNGGFKKIEDLMNVKGIGEKTFLKLKPMVVVSAGRAGNQ
jgi:competence protein ComEA